MQTKSQVSNLESALRIVRILDPGRRLKLFGVFLLMIVSAALEMLNIALLVPLVHILVSQPGEATLGGSLLGAFGLNLSGLGEGLTPFAAISVVVLAVFILKNALIVVAVYLQARFVASLRAFFIVRLVEGYASRGYEEHLSLNRSQVVHDVSKTVPAVAGSILQAALAIVMEILLALGALVALLVVDPIAASIAGAFVIVALSLYYVAIRQKVYEASGRSLALSRLLNRFSHFLLGATKESLVLRRSDYFIDRIKTVSAESARIDTVLSIVNQLPRIYGEVVIVGAVILVAAYIVGREGSIQSALPILVIFAAAAFRVLPSANRITQYVSSIRQTAPMLDAIYDDLVRSSRPEQDAQPRDHALATGANSAMSKNIVLSNLSYRYPNAPDWTLRNIDIEIGKGTAIAFVGRTGAGKSTLVDIILGLLPPTEGEILIDGAPVAARTDMWRGRIGYVPQSIYLMDDTLRRNIAIGIPDQEIDESRLQDVIRVAQLDDVLTSLPAGLDSDIGEEGIRLSGGQRQRIGIARALYSDPDVLVLDEATAALDSGTERDISVAIENLSGQKTLIIIAHRLGTVRRCDNLFYLEHGRIIGTGRFDTLITSCPPFRAMAEIAGEGGVLAGEPGLSASDAGHRAEEAASL